MGRPRDAAARPGHDVARSASAAAAGLLRGSKRVSAGSRAARGAVQRGAAPVDASSKDQPLRRPVSPWLLRMPSRSAGVHKRPTSGYPQWLQIGSLTRAHGACILAPEESRCLCNASAGHQPAAADTPFAPSHSGPQTHRCKPNAARRPDLPTLLPFGSRTAQKRYDQPESEFGVPALVGRQVPAATVRTKQGEATEGSA